MKLSIGFSVAAILIGAYMILIAHTTVPRSPIVASGWMGTALICTGLVSLTISEIFKK